jgi:hypothetical protein
MNQPALRTLIRITLLALSFSGGVAHADKLGNFEIQVVNSPTPPGPNQHSNYSFGATQTGSFKETSNSAPTAASQVNAGGALAGGANAKPLISEVSLPALDAASKGAPGQAGQPQNFSWGASNPTGQQSATDGQTGGSVSAAQDAGEAGQRPTGTLRGKGITSGKRQHKP